MNRLLRIAGREYVSYVRTIGFWLSLCLMPLVLTVSLQIPAIMDRAAPIPRLIILDHTGEGLGDLLSADLRGETQAPVRLVAPPAAVLTASGGPATAAALRQGLNARPAAFDAAAVLRGSGDAVHLNLWTSNLTDNRLESLLRDASRETLRRHRLMAAGVDPRLIAAADRLEPQLAVYSAKAAEPGPASLRDRLPSLVGFGMGLLLWSIILTGAGILLNSVIEEKSSRILEVLLTSASVPEVMGGKILGVAGVTATVLAVWAAVGGMALSLFAPGVGGDIVAVLLGKGLAIYFAFYLVIGYLMYASIFAAVGAFCETVREAQTLLGPVMLMLTIPVIFMGQSIRHPDAPILGVLSWIPPFTPFLMVARAAAGPPIWQILGTLTVMAVTTTAVVWLSGRAFRAGALSIGKLDRRAVLAAFAKVGPRLELRANEKGRPEPERP